ncbi:hypothetical protein A3D09_00555 [Candidatus Collierbacteria bacterium RIFCSPHIGHO2_02_FULL_49_10]|uniref:Homing endonuclease LAGLIDADG domain-containing protein n=2 Tax=Patescibacteria group TaxID=1783273 RepID=A0A1F5ETL6_9BACT|nr:MAG: hypothetical protein A3D09_00555 [Candidatus Collierbacteria bacterium RIFCSPHIGHO2_02_FULL_49_10]OGM90522.1 MAG: hypothetical protein A2755_03190 [Candidatus Wolfebacteria bacterium RIFCSPHIGHO2_01_FULL_48_22]
MNLDAQWITGFTDGEGCFYIGINPHPEMTAGYQVLPEFTVVQHKRDVKVLHALKNFFGCGVIRTNHGDRMAYRVRSLQHLASVIVPFFENHLLKTAKNQDFQSFRQVIQLLLQKEHLTTEGIQKIQAIAARMNRGRER